MNSIEEIFNLYGGKELFQLVHGTYNSTPERYQVCQLIKNGDTRILDLYVTSNKIVLKDFNFDESELLYNPYSGMDYSFDLLIFAIENKASLDMIKYIVERTPYNNFNYGIRSNKYKFRVPLFHAIANNDFKVADYLISKGADLQYEFRCTVGKVDDPWSCGGLKYCGYTEEDTELDWYLYIGANVINYIREIKKVNEENLKYLEKHGFSYSSFEKADMIREANRDENKEIKERIKKSIFGY